LDTLRFRAPFYRSTYTIRLRLIGNRVLDYIVVLVNKTFFSLAVTAKAIQANIK